MKAGIKKFPLTAAEVSLYGFFISTTFSISLSQILLGLALLFSIISIIFRKEKAERPRFGFIGLFILLFIGWSILSALLSSTPWISLLILKEEWLFLMIPVAACLVRSHQKINICLRLFALAAIVVSLYAFWQHFSGVDWYHQTSLAPAPSSGYRVSGTFAHRLTFGNYYAIASILLLGIAPYAKNRESKIIFYTAFFATTVATVFTYSRGPILAMAFGIIFFFALEGRRYIKILIPILAGIVIIIMIASPDVFSRYLSSAEREWKGEYAGSRQSIWRAGWRMALDNPLTGVGPGHFKEEYAAYRDKGTDRIYGHAHNDFINVAAYAGFPAAVFYLGIFVSIIIRIIKIRHRCTGDRLAYGMTTGAMLATIVFLITSLYEATFADEEIRLLLMAIWGLFLAAEYLVKLRLPATENIEKGLDK